MKARTYITTGAVLSALALAGCGANTTSSTDSGATQNTTSTTPPQTPAPPPSSRCIIASGYKGLYSTVTAFRSDHAMVAPTVRLNGAAWYGILSTEHGCVTSYSIDMFSKPPSGAADMIVLTDGIYLPEDIQRVVDKTNCTVYTSATLTKASGYKFAVATSTAQSSGAPADAEIGLTNDGSCP